METAIFMGFKPEAGLAIYKAISLNTSDYTIFGLFRKAVAGDFFVIFQKITTKKSQSQANPG
jgi:hypothetical protein